VGVKEGETGMKNPYISNSLFIDKFICKYLSAMDKGGSTYIITNKNRSTLYTGVTSDLESRIMEHRLKEYPGSFSANIMRRF
jgi:hypothetical protein